MEQIRTYNSFSEIKSTRADKVDDDTRMRRHKEFENLIHALVKANTQPSLMCKPIEFKWQVID